MSATIWKYPLEIVAQQKVKMPQGAQIVSVQAQRGEIQCWALVDPARSIEEKTIVFVGTGGSVPKKEMRFIESVQLAGGFYVWHVFEVL